MPNPAAPADPAPEHSRQSQQSQQSQSPPPETPAKAPDNVGKAPVAPGSGAPDAGGGLPLPHERDESLASRDDKPRKVMERARKDIESGQVDTDLRATPGQDAGQRDHLLSPDGGGAPVKPSR